MMRSLIAMPFRLSLRVAGVALHGATEVAGQALSLAGALTGVRSRPSPSAPARPRRPREPPGGPEPPEPEPDPRSEAPAPVIVAPPAPPPPPAEPPPPLAAVPPPAAPPAPAPDLQAPVHISPEVELVETVAEAGAQDGAGAEVHVAEPWPGYRQMKAGDIIDRITGASVAELATVSLYERAGKQRQTVLAAVDRELHRADRS